MSAGPGGPHVSAEPRPSVLLSGFPEALGREAALAQAPQHGRASVRKSGRYSQASNRYSRSSLARGSIRGARATDAAGLPFERIVCIDEHGRDRTPKPLVACIAHGTGGEPQGGWSSEMPGETTTGTETLSVLSAGHGPGAVPSMHSLFGGSEMTEASPDGMPLELARIRTQQGAAAAINSAAAAARAVGAGQSALGSAGRLAAEGGGMAEGHASGREATGTGEASSAVLPSPHQHGQRSLRSKASQSAPVALASRGVQVLPWELLGSAGNTESGAAGSSDASAASGLLAIGGNGEGAEGEPNGGDEEADQEAEAALLAMPHIGMLGGSPSSRRGSGTGLPGLPGRMSTMYGDVAFPSAASRRSSGANSRRSSMQSPSDWSPSGSTRASIVSSRASFAAFVADGRSSVMSSAAGYGSGSGRASIMLQQQHVQSRGVAAPSHPGAAAAAVPQLSAAELAARAARRQRAEQERALARLPGLLRRLQAAERAVLLNLKQPKLAQFHHIQLCEPPEEPAAEDGTADSSPRQAELGDGTGTAAEPAHPLGGEAGEAECTASSAAGGYKTSDPAAPGSRKAILPAALASTSSVFTAGGPVKQPELQLLWAWASELTGELPVSCLAWSRAAPGLLAVGYGRLEYAVSGEGGVVAVWSLANPAHPLWHAATPTGVSCLDWSSKASSSCLAVGFFDGSVALYDVRGPGGSAPPLARAPPASGSGSGGHAEPVWQLRHVPKASDPGQEMLVSISSDGRLLEWKHAQGLEQVELLRLRRRTPTATAEQGSRQKAPAGAGAGSAVKDGSQAASTSRGQPGRAAGGTCFAFSPADPRTYLVGTEEGGVHKCSTAFTEQYMQSYSGHLAAVYQVCWSPFSPTHFLTASADWSVRLWSESQLQSLWTFQLPTAKSEVADVAFCPAAATLFAAAVGNTLQVWDVEHSVLTPRAMATRFGVRLTALAFSQVAPAVVAGTDDGSVLVYSLAGMYDVAGAGGRGDEDQRQRLEAALRHHTAQHTSD